ncbi:MAG TPA: protein kinase [Candidatus Nanopelagicales bacterium]
MTDNRASVAPNRQVGRFTLTDLAEQRHGCQVWRATDSTLNREVVLWLMPREPGLVEDIALSTRIAATVDDRRIVRTLDVFETDEHLVVVTEWSAGEVLRDHLHEPLPPPEAARIAYEIAGALEAAHAKGIAHGLLRPSNVLICHDGEVRVSGLGLDAVLAGVDPVADGDPVRADVHGVGAILYACLTGRWPGPATEGLPAAPDVAGNVPPPSRLLADIPEALDDFCARTVIPIESPRGRAPLAGTGQERELLGATLTDMTGERRPLAAAPGEADRRSSTLGRVAVGGGVLLLALGLAWLGWQFLGSGSAEPVAAPEPSRTPSASASEAPAERPKPVTYRIAGARDFDPLGNGEENPGRVPFAYDGDKNTAWRTVTYYNKSLDKPGVGLLVDLGAPRAIGQVTLDLVGNGTDLQVLTSNDPGNDPRNYDVMAQATEAGEKVTLKSPDPTSARYVLIWLTGLPQVDGGWRGGIRELKIQS